MSGATGRFDHGGEVLAYVTGHDLLEVFRPDGGGHFARIPLTGIAPGTVDDDLASRLYAAWKSGFEAGVPEGRAEKLREIRKALAI